MPVTPNDYVKVKLTEYGKEVLREKRRQLIAERPATARRLGDPIPEEDDDGWSRWQLWWLMRQFGGEQAGMKFVFDDLKISDD